MKKKTTILILILIFTLSMSIIFAACDNNTEDLSKNWVQIPPSDIDSGDLPPANKPETNPDIDKVWTREECEGHPVYLSPSEKSIKESKTKYAYCYHLDEMLCESCYGYPYRDFIGTCPHLKASENITRASVVKLYNTESVFGKADEEKKEISSQLEKFYKDINGSEKEFGGWSSDRFGFESAVDSYCGICRGVG